ncbi:MAG: hypothetical protein HY823_00230 [Acidobacteria bacterium]|nr:hypothetical protein [Acidobacteriota bacterium]
MQNPFPICLYLNQKYVFDLLAMMEDGFSFLQNIKSTSSEKEDREKHIESEIGVKNVFAFLGVSLKGGGSKKDQTGQTNETSSERVHTPNSLFGKMRTALYDKGLITVNPRIDIESGTFVELKVTLKKNPMISTLESMAQLFETAIVFIDAGVESQKHAGKSVSNKKSPTENQKILDQMKIILAQLNQGSTIDLLAYPVQGNPFNLVLTIDPSFLSDPRMSDLIDGDYTILGKVSKVIQNKTETINLLRKTSFGKMNTQMLESFKFPLEKMSESGLQVEELTTEVLGPAMQIIPIAIFA